MELDKKKNLLYLNIITVIGALFISFFTIPLAIIYYLATNGIALMITALDDSYSTNAQSKSSTVTEVVNLDYEDQNAETVAEEVQDDEFEGNTSEIFAAAHRIAMELAVKVLFPDVDLDKTTEDEQKYLAKIGRTLMLIDRGFRPTEDDLEEMFAEDTN